jgi:hypothetical protein
MQLAQVNDFWSLDFSLHVIAALIIVLANWKYFMGNVRPAAEKPEAVPVG